MEMLNKLSRGCCPKCGAPNNCAIEAGKSISACWCISRPVIKGADYKDSCLCRDCLKLLELKKGYGG